MKLSIFAACVLALSPMAAAPVLATAAAPAAPAAPANAAAPIATPAPVAETAPKAAAPAAAPAPAGDATYVPLKPVDGIGQPVDRGMDFQPQVTEIGQYAKWFNNVMLLPIMAVICLFVLGLMFWVSVRFRAKANPVPSTTTHNTTIEVIWTAVPIIILVAIAVPSIDLLAQQYKPPSKDAITVKVKGYQWNWGYEYPDYEIGEYISKMVDEKTAKANGEPYLLAVDNRMVVPVGTEIKLIISGGDVIHSFAVPALWTKMDAVPGRLNETKFKADKVGVYYGQCSELCGIDHAFMPIAVEVLPKDKFEAWVRFKGGKVPSDTPLAVAPAAAPAAAPVPAPAAAPAKQ
jgi:cytochrome c oxidase subunit II